MLTQKHVPWFFGPHGNIRIPRSGQKNMAHDFVVCTWNLTQHVSWVTVHKAQKTRERTKNVCRPGKCATPWLWSCVNGWKSWHMRTRKTCVMKRRIALENYEFTKCHWEHVMRFQGVTVILFRRAPTNKTKYVSPQELCHVVLCPKKRRAMCFTAAYVVLKPCAMSFQIKCPRKQRM